MLKVRLNVQGRVQGVGFRFFTKILADKSAIYGTVRNEADGSVTIEATGEEEKIKKFIEAVKDSPSPSGHVSYVHVENDPLIQERHSFDVIY